MKKSVILDIFNGERGLRETMNMPKDTIRKSMDIVSDTYSELKKSLSPELLALHQKLVDTLTDSMSEEVDFYFAEGFKLGLLTGIECMEN